MAELRRINPASLPPSLARSQAVEASGGQRMLFISGQIGTLPDGRVAHGMREQVWAAVDNLRTVLAAAGMESSDVVKYTIYLTDESLLGEFRAALATALPLVPPATTLLFVRALASPALLVEIEAIAVK